MLRAFVSYIFYKGLNSFYTHKSFNNRFLTLKLYVIQKNVILIASLYKVFQKYIFL